jgi:hypothetical protein
LRNTGHGDGQDDNNGRYTIENFNRQL